MHTPKLFYTIGIFAVLLITISFIIFIISRPNQTLLNTSWRNADDSSYILSFPNETAVTETIEDQKQTGTWSFERQLLQISIESEIYIYVVESISPKKLTMYSSPEGEKLTFTRIEN